MVEDANHWLQTLPRLREVEAAAGTAGQRAAIRRAVGHLFCAARAQGWGGVELARASGYPVRLISYRVQQARAASAGRATGLDLPSPTRDQPAASPVDTQWVAPQQARRRLGVGVTMLYRWRVHGLLPRAR